MRNASAFTQKSPWLFSIIDLTNGREHVMAVDGESERDTWVFHLQCEISSHPKQPVTSFSSRSRSLNISNGRALQFKGQFSNHENGSPATTTCDLPPESPVSGETEKMARFAERWKREAAFWKQELARHVENENRYRAEADLRFQALRAEVTNVSAAPVRLPAVESGSDTPPSSAFENDLSVSTPPSSEDSGIDRLGRSDERDSSSGAHGRAFRGGSNIRHAPSPTGKPRSPTPESNSESGLPGMSDPHSGSDSANSSAAGRSLWSSTRSLSGLASSSCSAALDGSDDDRCRTTDDQRRRYGQSDASAAWRHALLSSTTMNQLVGLAAEWFAEPALLVRLRARRTLRVFRQAVEVRRLRRLRALEKAGVGLSCWMAFTGAGADSSSSEEVLPYPKQARVQVPCNGPPIRV